MIFDKDHNLFQLVAFFDHNLTVLYCVSTFCQPDFVTFCVELLVAL